MINLEKIAGISIEPEVRAFMRQYGTNHSYLNTGWKRDPRMSEEIPLLKQQLAYTLQNMTGLEVAKRILNRLRAAVGRKEDAALLRLFNDDTGALK